VNVLEEFADNRPIRELKISAWQDKLLRDEHSDVIAITCGYGSGKTFGSWLYILDRLAMNPGCDAIYVEPQYSLIKRVAIPACREVCELLGYIEDVHYKVFYSIDNPRIELISGQTVFFISGERPETIVGITTACVAVADEIALMPEEVLSRLRSRVRYKKAKKCQVAVFCTPEGLNWFSDMFDSDTQAGWQRVDDVGKDCIKIIDTEEPNGEVTRIVYRRIRATTYSNKHNLAPSYIPGLLDTWKFNRDYIDSYVFGLFRPFAVGRAYSNYRSNLHKTVSIDPNPHKPIHLTWDFNICPQWVSLQEFNERLPGKQNKRYWIALHNANEGHDQLDDSVIEFSVKHPRKRFANTPIFIYGDPTGYAKSHKTKLSDFKNIKDMLNRLGYNRVEIVAAKTAPLERVSVDTVQKAFCENLLLICDRCDKALTSVIRTCWEDGERKKLAKPSGETWTHPMDAIKYFLICVLAPNKQLIGLRH
jgi:hypothetical protein